MKFVVFWDNDVIQRRVFRGLFQCPLGKWEVPAGYKFSR